jgi:hypothetical protein
MLPRPGPVTDSRRLALAILLYGLIAGGTAAEPIAASRGVWAGPIGERSSASPSGAGKVELRIDGSENRFSVNLAGPGGSLLVSEFQASSRANVFDPPPAKSLMSFLGRASPPVNALEGKPLVWARRAGEELVIYRLELQGGPYRLDRLVLRPAGNRLEMSFERREHERPSERFSASLERQSP